MKNVSLYQYIIENLDPEEQNFKPKTLPDEQFPTIPHPLGAEEGCWKVSKAPSMGYALEKVYLALKNYIQIPSPEYKQRLYQLLREQPMIAIADKLSKMLAEDKITEAYYNLARSLFYNAKDRGPIKFAYILFGLYGMERIAEEDSELWEDLIKIAQCEEFTYFFTFACKIGNYKPNKAFWRLIGCTEGWGRAFAIESCECTDEAQELWLIQNGLDLTVEYPVLSRHIIEATNLSKYLQEEDISERTYAGAMALINAFLFTITDFETLYFERSINTAKIKPMELFWNILRHSTKHADIPERILQVLNMRLSLENLLDNFKMEILDRYECERLLAECDSIVYAKDWTDYVKNNLFSDKEVNYELCDFACEMDMDIWKQLFDYLCDHPHEYRILAYLFSYNDELYQETALHFVEHNLKAYSFEESALLVPLRYLALHPGKGLQVVSAALKSPYDWPREVACSTINEWGPDWITEALREDLLVARELSNSKVVTASIDVLLQNKALGIEDILDNLE